MRLWKVKTWADLTIETKSIFGKKKKYSCFFTWNTKYIYAETADDAKMKYGDYFFSPSEDGYNDYTLSLMRWTYNTKSNNMKFNLNFNERIVHTHEHIIVLDSDVTANIDEVKKNSTADDFRNWLMNGTNPIYSMNDIDWIGK